MGGYVGPSFGDTGTGLPDISCAKLFGRYSATQLEDLVNFGESLVELWVNVMTPPNLEDSKKR